MVIHCPVDSRDDAARHWLHGAGAVNLNNDKVVRIGAASAQLLDSVTAVEQLLTVDGLDYLVFDFLGEGSMGHLSLMSKFMPGGGFAREFVDLHVIPHLPELLARGIRVVANAGGVDPAGCAAALRASAEAIGLRPRIAFVEGDDLRGRSEEMRARGVRDMFDDRACPGAIESMNAYLGAFPIAAALDEGADVVIVGRSVDSAVTLGPLIHAFGWSAEQHDLLAAGTLVGHLIECGTQVTGGTFTDWRSVPDWANGGFPIAECHADGSAVITKPPGTGGLVTPGTVIEQMLYEVSDPQAYVVPDVVCDFSAVSVTQQGPDRVFVSGARGYPPTATYKVCATWQRGWRCTVLQPIVAIDAVPRAERQAAALLAHHAALLERRGIAPVLGSRSEVIGAESCLGPRARTRGAREVIARVVVEHAERAAAELFGRESYAALTTMSAGSLIPVSPVVVPVLRVFSFLLEKTAVPVTLDVDGRTRQLALPAAGGFDPAAIVRPPVPEPAPACRELVPVPLLALAIARSGEKGNLFNMAVIARRPELLPWIRAALSPEGVADWYAHLFDEPAARRVERFEVPGVQALNFVVHECLGGGIMGSMRLDAAAKNMAQLLLEFPVPVPPALRVELDPALLAAGDGAPWLGAP
ncbi:MAG: hypothetical protein CALGDGBN_01026 [Pseudomonadales bacterium]|nr:hypothetical protein [Pseudomonadales bacterium]